MSATCELCETVVGTRAYLEEGRVFCCAGCHAVYNVLQARGRLVGYRDDPLFHEALRMGVISNPDLLEKVRANQPIDRCKLYVEVTDLWCPSCAQVISWIVGQMGGVLSCVVDYATDLAAIEYCPMQISREAVLKEIQALGYHCVELQDSQHRKVSRALWMRFGVAAFCSINLMMLAYPVYASYFIDEKMGYVRLFEWISFLLALPVVFYAAWPLWKRVPGNIRAGIYGMETLVVVGVSAAFTYSVYALFSGGSHVYFDSLSVIVTFVLLGKIVETRAKFSAKESLFRLTRSVPRRGRIRLADGSEQFVPLKEVKPGDLLVALAGEKIVLEGVVVEGAGAIDESLMTGESLPVPKEAGSDVLGGTLVRQGRVVYKVTCTEDQTLLKQMIGNIERDIGHKTHYVRVSDQISARFVPLVLMLAAGTAGWLLYSGAGVEVAMLRAVSILLISCPCAIGIAGPLAESYLMNGLASMGAIVRNRGCLRFLGRETVLIFDKTGTITEGRYRVLSGLERLSVPQLLALKGMAAQSIHPVSVAINDAIAKVGQSPIEMQEWMGKGLSANYEDHIYLLGSPLFMQQQEVKGLPQIDHEDDVSQVYFACDGDWLSTLRLGDVLRPGAEHLVKNLEVENSYLISGDSSSCVAGVARQCGFSHWLAQQSPLEKRAWVENFRQEGHIVGMVGDGMNDAPALTCAHVGISTVSATDVSMQVSDLLLTTDRLDVLPKIRRLAVKGRAIIIQNLAWSFSYNIVGIGLAFSGALTPLYSAIAMVFSSLTVLFNALRLNR